MKYNFPILNSIENRFYFGIGGIGDLLLLMSTFYDTIDDKTDVVFICNNVTAIRKMSELFPQVNRWWFYPRSTFYCNVTQWYEIVDHPRCIGTGVTPNEFEYIKDWIRCGEYNVFDFYLVNKHPIWAKPHSITDTITIQPIGGFDANRISRIPKKKIQEFISLYSNYDIVLIGSDKDKLELGEINGARWSINFAESVELIKNATMHIGVNSWCKTMSGLAGVKTYIWPSEYVVEPSIAYNHDKDPADYVFLDNWGFLDANPV